MTEKVNMADSIALYAYNSAIENTVSTKKDEPSIFMTTEEVNITQGGGKDKEKTLNALKNEINSGNAECINQFQYLFRQIDRFKYQTRGSFIMLEKVPEGCETLGDVKQKLNLPDGCLINNIVKGTGGGEYDKHKAVAPLSISVDVLAGSLGIKPEEIKSLFK